MSHAPLFFLKCDDKFISFIAKFWRLVDDHSYVRDRIYFSGTAS